MSVWASVSGDEPAIFDVDCEPDPSGETDECEKCEGTGEVDFDPACDPYAPDNWREWEGIA